MRALLELEDRPDFKYLKNSTYVKALKHNEVIILVIEIKNPGVRPKDLGRLGRVLSSKLSSKVRVINRVSGNIRELAMQLIYPARVAGVNTLWLPDGSVEHIVRIPKADLRYLPTRMSSLEEVLSKITGMSVRIRVEY